VVLEGINAPACSSPLEGWRLGGGGIKTSLGGRKVVPPFFRDRQPPGFGIFFEGYPRWRSALPRLNPPVHSTAASLSPPGQSAIDSQVDILSRWRWSGRGS
jgi:hypothetical protein